MKQWLFKRLVGERERAAGREEVNSTKYDSLKAAVCQAQSLKLRGKQYRRVTRVGTLALCRPGSDSNGHFLLTVCARVSYLSI